MADAKISALPSATTPLDGTEVLPIVQAGTTDKITVNNLAAGNLKSQSTTGVLQVSGPAAASTRVMTVPDANFTVARTDAAQTFTGTQTFGTAVVNTRLLVGTATAFNSSNTFIAGTNTADLQLTVGGSGSVPGVAIHFGNNGGTANAANSLMKLGLMGGTSRSISAAGTINASGADYAEYMTKAGDFTVAKGDVVGIDAEGKLTNVFADAISFCVKSTNPSYVGGDVWGCGFDGDPEGLEAARQCVDRIAFAGQVPVNVTGATPGQFIVPVNDNGAIKGITKNEADMTLAEYMKSVGRVIAIEADGRAKIIVKMA